MGLTIFWSGAKQRFCFGGCRSVWNQTVRIWAPGFLSWWQLTSHALNYNLPYCLYLPRCNEFVLTCEVHRHTLNNPDQHCCDILFDTEPIFTGKGTCYRTNKTIYEYYPYSFSSIKIWTNLLQDQTPGSIRIIAKSNYN